MYKVQQLFELNQKEYDKLCSIQCIKIIEEEKSPVHLSHQTDDFGNEISDQEYTYNVTIKSFLPKSLAESHDLDMFLMSVMY